MTAQECADIFNDLGVCGCMEGAAIARWVHRALSAINARSNDVDGAQDEINRLFLHDASDEASYDNAVYWLLWATLERAHLIEHGGNVMGSWLTPKGRALLAALNS